MKRLVRQDEAFFAIIKIFASAKIYLHFAEGKLSFGEADYHSAEGGLSFERSEINLLKVLSLAVVSGNLQ